MITHRETRSSSGSSGGGGGGGGGGPGVSLADVALLRRHTDILNTARQFTRE